MAAMRQDLSYAFRRLSKSPGFVLAVVISIALGIAAMWQRITGRMSDELSQFRTAREVSALMRLVAPGTVRVPVPGGALQFRILAICDRPPTG